MIDKWKMAVVHLECATDSVDFNERIRQIDDLHKSLEESKISQKEFTEKISSCSRDIRYQGTAIFLKNQKKKEEKRAKKKKNNKIENKKK
jgi:hypothetical protein